MATGHVLKLINMGHKDSSDIAQFVSEKYIMIDAEGIVWIKPIMNIEVRFPNNGCTELVFDKDNAADVMFDTIEEEEEHIIYYA